MYDPRLYVSIALGGSSQVTQASTADVAPSSFVGFVVAVVVDCTPEGFAQLIRRPSPTDSACCR